MRLAGRISDWKEDKGYGFVVPHDGGDRAFVHIKAFQPGSRRPVDGDLVSYAVTKDERGRTNAVQVRYPGQKIGEARARPRIAPPPPRRPLPRLAVGLGFLVIVALAAGSGRLPTAVAIGYVAASAVSWLAYTLDKGAAGTRARRVPEARLHLIDLFGGWPGALVAQQLARHKTMKASFQAVFWFTVVANLAGVAWLVRSGIAAALDPSVA